MKPTSTRFAMSLPTSLITFLYPQPVRMVLWAVNVAALYQLKCVMCCIPQFNAGGRRRTRVFGKSFSGFGWTLSCEFSTVSWMPLLTISSRHTGDELWGGGDVCRTSYRRWQVGSYVGCCGFSSLSRHRLLRLRFSQLSSAPQGCLTLGHDRFLPQSFLFITNMYPTGCIFYCASEQTSCIG
jgi:hypothetical protein